ncbi:alpha/beta hydrolase [uncultured Eudoraea sp.]|uniref:alpha/beta hydrolase n=1 Tax=uncultured Eudoraea sp. TaxID=1035614 RepID=UPI00260644F5|nr:alpha/beta hydrolase [uncultured Eudoraea sp.]
MKRVLFLLLFVCLAYTGSSQTRQAVFKKGRIIDSIRINDSISETYKLYLPKKFDGKGTWPIIFVFDMDGKNSQVLNIFKEAAEENGFLLASSNDISDTLSISKNVLIASRMFQEVAALLPVNSNRFYTAGFTSGAKFASLVPFFIKQVKGVISCGSFVASVELVDDKNPFHFIGIVGNEDYNYTQMLQGRELLNKMKFPNNLLVFDGGDRWTDYSLIDKALKILTLSAIAKGNVAKNDEFVMNNYRQNLAEFQKLLDSNQMLPANNLLNEIISVYRPHLEVDSLREKEKNLTKDKSYRAQRRLFNNVLLQELFIKEDYNYNLIDDLSALNYNNLGWWNYQMTELKKYDNKPDPFERQMGKRLLGYLNALIEDNIDIEMGYPVVNDEALSFLWMLKTIAEPKAYQYYLKIISDSSKYEDFGTALFYLEELLKNGYEDKTRLYSLDNTALLRIMPEFNAIVNKYLEGSRYDAIIEE